MSIIPILLSFFQVASVMFAPGHLTSLLTLGINTGLVMDVGYTETLVVPVSFLLEFWNIYCVQTLHIGRLV